VAGKRHFDSDIERVDTIIEEERSLFEFCRAKGLFSAENLERLADGPISHQGNEHRVFLHPDGGPPRVTKITLPPNYGRLEHTPFLYLERLALCQALFPVLDIRFEDFAKAGPDSYSFVTGMRAFLGPFPELSVIDAFLKERGFHLMAQTATIDYASQEAGIRLRDCHPKNWIDADGHLILIDIIPEIIV